MPDVDGIELLRHVRGVDAWSNLPVISKLPVHSALVLPQVPACACLWNLLYTELTIIKECLAWLHHGLIRI